MFFFQDDIGVLIQLSTIPFWRFLVTPQAEHFAPLLHILYWISFRLFHLQFTPYVVVILVIHLLNIFLLGKIAYIVTGKKFLTFLAMSLFTIHLTYTEPFLWMSAHGVVLATFFVGSAFLSWYRYSTDKKAKDLIFSLFSLFCASISFGVGVGIGALFAIASLIIRKRIGKSASRIIAVYGAVGIVSYMVGPMISGSALGKVVGQFYNLQDIFRYASFVIAGVSRGVVGRFFLPGFEPRHFAIIPTVISFIPFIVICYLLFVLLRKKKTIQKKLLIVCIIFVFYPYVWAGFLRYQFGLKQALAQRYAYPSLFFFILLLVLLLKSWCGKHLNRYKKIISLVAIMIITVQMIVFISNARQFEIIPLQTQRYFAQLQFLFETNTIILDLPIPSVFHQDYSISQLAPVLSSKKMVFIKPDEQLCTDELRRSLQDKIVLDFYREQLGDERVLKVFSNKQFEECESQIKKV